MTGRELLLGSSFRAVLGQDAGSQWTSWGQGASVSRFSAAMPGLELNGESATGSMGMDYERGPLLMGFAMTHSLGEGTAQDAGWRYALGSTATMAMPLCASCAHRPHLGVGACGNGHGAAVARYRRQGGAELPHGTLAMTLAATGVRGELLTPAEAGGFALALKADAFWVRAEVRADHGVGVREPRGRTGRVEPGAGGARRLAHLLSRKRRGADAVARDRGAP